MSDSLTSQRNSAVSSFNILINSNQAKDITLNNISYKALITVKILRDKVIKTIQMNQGIMKYGDYFQYYNNSTKVNDTYLVKSRIEPTLLDYDEAFMENCNSRLKFKTVINNVEELIEIPMIAGNGTLNIQENKYFEIVDDNLTCEIGFSEIDKVKYIKDNGIVSRFIINGKCWKVKGIDFITNVIDNSQGIIIVKLESDLFVEGDDILNNIALNPLDVIIVPPVSTYQIISSTGDYNYINLSALRTFKIVNGSSTAITDTFAFTLEQCTLNPTITPNQLVTLTDNITTTSIRLTANSSIKGSLNVVATCGRTGEIIKKTIRIKGLTDL